MTVLEAPAKVNLSLHVEPPTGNGYHPLDSLVQTIEWCDILEIGDVDDDGDTFTVDGADLDPEDNLVTRAIRKLREHAVVPPMRIHLEKRIPVAAGLGGGSSDAAATVYGVGRSAGLDEATMQSIADQLGADVPLFLVGGTLRMTGFGEKLSAQRALEGFAVAIAVPEFGLLTADVYKRWDEMEGPIGETMPLSSLPPVLREDMPLRNDLLPAAMSIEPRLGDFIADLRGAWETAVSMTGSGSACFAYFNNIDEALSAAQTVAAFSEVAVGVDLRGRGVAFAG